MILVLGVHVRVRVRVDDDPRLGLPPGPPDMLRCGRGVSVVLHEEPFVRVQQRDQEHHAGTELAHVIGAEIAERVAFDGSRSLRPSGKTVSPTPCPEKTSVVDATKSSGV